VAAGPAVKIVSGTVATNYNISVRFFGPPMTAQQQALFTTAAARISGVVTGALMPVGAFGINIDDYCGTSGAGTLNEVISGLVIMASVRSIDGPYNIVAQGGPCATGVEHLPVLGAMVFDSDDLALLSSSALQDVITHEMLHSLGFGTLWNHVIEDAQGNVVFERHLADESTFTYTAAQGILGCRAIGGFNTCAVNVPVANTGGPGTVNSHWRESTFQNELMTGVINNGAMPFSRMTAASLIDLGYTVNLEAADPFTIPGGNARVSGATDAPARLLVERTLVTPRPLR